MVELTLLAALSGVVSCGAPTAGESNFNLIFRYGVGAINELNTFKGTYTKDMVLEPPITVELSLSREELDRIYKKMVATDFFNYPDIFSVSVPPGEPVGRVTPHLSYYFKVESNSKTKELHWVDYVTNADERAEKLRELIKLIIEIIKSKEAYQKLPPPRGGYI